MEEYEDEEGSATIQMPMVERAGDIEKSMEEMLRAQYTSREFRDVFAATEFTRREIFALANAAANRMIMEILAITSEQVENSRLDPIRYDQLRTRLELQSRIKKEPTALAFALYDSFMYFYGLGKISLERKSRGEAVKIATARVHEYREGKDVGFMDRLRGRLMGGDRIGYRGKG